LLTQIFPFLIFLFTTASLLVVRSLALKFGYSDKPGGRKKHENAVPPIGGIVIIPVFLLAAYLTGMDGVVQWPLGEGLIALMVMGAIDDVAPLHHFLKFTIMVWAACFVVIFGETQILNLGNLFGFGNVEVGVISKAFTVMCLVWLMNAINMMDGVDGLAGGFCALVIFWMMVACLGAKDAPLFYALSLIFACIMGFLVLNMRFPWIVSAKVFLGDSGSLCLGLLIGWFAIKTTQGNFAPLEPATVIWIIALPVMDAFALFIARSIRGIHPFKADRRHLHHRFLDAGFSIPKTTFIMLMLVSLMALFGFVCEANDVPAFILFYLWLVVFCIHTACIMHPKGYTYLARYIKIRFHQKK